MAKTKKISINAFERVMKDNENTLVLDWHGIEVTVVKSISLKDMIAFVNYVVNNCISDEGDYLPEAENFAFKVALLEKYANFTLPTNVEDKYDLVMRTDAADTVLSRVNQNQIRDISEAIDKKISNKLSMNTNLMLCKIQSLCEAIEGATDSMSEALNGVSSDELSKFVKAMTNGEIDEEKIVKTYISSVYDE